MPPTVKSLEERIDDLADDMSGLKTQVAVLTAKLDIVASGLAAVQAQLQTVATQLATVVAALAATTARLDTVSAKLDTQANDYAAFKSKSETTFALTRWIGAFAAVAVIGVIGSAFTVVRSVGNLEATVQQQQKVLDDIRRDVSDLKSKVK